MYNNVIIIKQQFSDGNNIMAAPWNKKLVHIGHCPLDLTFYHEHYTLLEVIFVSFPTFLQDLETFVNGSGDDGFIVFTLGSMVSAMPEEKAKLFFNAFRQIPQRVTITLRDEITLLRFSPITYIIVYSMQTTLLLLDCYLFSSNKTHKFLTTQARQTFTH